MMSSDVLSLSIFACCVFLAKQLGYDIKHIIGYSLSIIAFLVVISILIGFIASALKVRALSMLGTIISIASAIPSFMLVIRRLHDLDRPTWWCIGCIIPIVNFALAVYLLFFKGTDGPNQYGPDPLEVQD